MSARPEAVNGYLRDPRAIAAESQRAIDAAAGESLAALPAGVEAIARRLVHSTAQPELADALAWAGAPAEAAATALRGGAPILADAAMVEAGIVTRALPAGNAVRCYLNHAGTPELAERLGTTRSAAAIELARDELAGAVIALGNAPTALFRLLEMLEGGAAAPAAILAFPVGFVGASEAKDALRQSHAAPAYVTLPGRRGGSPMAAAAVNAVAAWAREGR